jgi:hypothetical protein
MRQVSSILLYTMCFTIWAGLPLPDFIVPEPFRLSRVEYLIDHRKIK